MPKEIQKSCNANITYGSNCQDQITIEGMKQSDDMISVSLSNFLKETASSKYCTFIITATATRTLTVEGNLLGKSEIWSIYSETIASVSDSPCIIILIVWMDHYTLHEKSTCSIY